MNKTDLSQKEVFFLGVGGAFEPEFGNSSLAVQYNNQKLLIDCGYQVFSAMKQISWFPDIVVLSHLHNDHVGSLSSYIYYYNYVLRKGKLRMAYQDQDFLSKIKGLLAYSISDLNDFVDFIPLKELSFIKSHETHGLHSKNLSTYAFELNLNKKFVLSGDLGSDSYILEHIQLSHHDVVFHDCSFYEKQNAHAFYKNLQSKKWPCRLLAYHNNPLQKPSDCSIDLVYDSEFYPKPLFDINDRWKQK